MEKAKRAVLALLGMIERRSKDQTEKAEIARLAEAVKKA